ncbi:capsular exopolysaccharide family [Crinalium epipsammum PCC 9333]|uniref:non-specific protein-tyrosine kinase n=1 Tax=Crinalium epipsammum PCC 9333 TaxID=1173022 RepID=K9W1T3_9CYAN|nr:polysaccharide biosynthesis tyrosine autokinase [Crinalium epipsammum]AFZ14328.1 capsular exopolysaccharide family [Crinalium epipsammum PCC 9333]
MDEFTQYWFIFKRRWLPASLVFTLVLGVTALVTFQQKPIYQAQGQILIKKNNSTSLLLNLDKIDGSAGAGNQINTQAELINSIPVAQETIATLNLSQKPESFLKPLKVTNIRSTDILQVSYTDTDPAKAAKIINTVMSIYIKSDVNAQRSEAKAAREFVEKQLPIIEVTVRQAEQDLRKFKEQNKVLDLAGEATSTTEVLNNLTQQISEAQSKYAAETSRVQGLQQLFGNDLNATVVAASVGESPTTQKLLSNLQDIQEKLATERTRFQEGHPVIEDLKSKEANLKALLQQQLQQTFLGQQPLPNRIVPLADGVQQSLITDFARASAERASLEKQIYALANVEAAYRERINTLPKLEQQQRELERRLKTAQSTYEILSPKLQEIRVQENQTVGNARIVTPASIPERAIAPKKAQNLAVGGLLGILLGIAVALALETTDKSIKDPEDAKRILGYPLLGTIPIIEHMDSSTTIRFGNQQRIVPSIVVTNTAGSPISEAYRMIHTSLRFMSLDNQLKVMVISSSVPKEGKSTTAANLAVAISQLGQRVLLIDADMRKPSQHKIWQLPNETGLSTVLTGQSDFNDAVVEVMENLEVLTAGTPPPNPLILIDSSQMAVLVGQSAQTYDFVIIDSPPVSVAADTTILGRMANGLMFVVRPGVANSGNLTYCKEILDQSSQNVLGVVVNGVSRSSGSYYNNYYYYNSYATQEVEQDESATKRSS